jgi:hypothetical protein
MPWPTILTVLLRGLLLGSHRLVLENLALRQQLVVLKRKVPTRGSPTGTAASGWSCAWSMTAGETACTSSSPRR